MTVRPPPSNQASKESGSMNRRRARPTGATRPRPPSNRITVAAYRRGTRARAIPVVLPRRYLSYSADRPEARAGAPAAVDSGGLRSGRSRRYTPPVLDNRGPGPAIQEVSDRSSEGHRPSKTVELPGPNGPP